MWQLLLPPVIVIISFTFLLWFLAKKQSDPFVQEEINRLTSEEVETYNSFRTWFWGLTEKWTKKARVMMLRFHNTLGDWSKVARENKEHKGQEAPDETAPSIEAPVLPRTDIPQSTTRIQESFIHQPITRGETKLESVNTAPPVRTNISDIKKEATSHEEDFISSIAKNPKDFSAYEKLGDYYMDNGNIKDAKECYRQVLRLSPANRDVKMKIRRLEKMLG